MASFRLLKIIFVILFLITFGEVIYYVSYQLNIEKYTQKLQAFDNDTETAKFLLQSLKNNIEQYQNKILIKSTRTDIYEANIKRIAFGEGIKNIFRYDVLITMEYKPDEDFTISLNKNDLDKTQVYVLDNGNLLPYSLSALKKGDRVKIELVTNILEYFDKNTERIKMIKINQ